jgi:hypothetical protein
MRILCVHEQRAPDEGKILNPAGRVRTTGGLTHVQVIDRKNELLRFTRGTFAGTPGKQFTAPTFGG